MDCAHELALGGKRDFADTLETRAQRSWYWGALILGTYSLALAVPMAAIAISIGDFAWKYARHVWLMRGLQWTSAAVMIAVAVLVAFERARFINTVVFTILSAVGGTPHPSVAQL